MKQRTFFRTVSIVAALTAYGCLPLWAAEKQAPEKRTWGVSANPYVEPSAIEPVTGVLPAFAPVSGTAMNGSFSARYSLLAWEMAAAKSENKPMGSMKVNFSKGKVWTVEKRDGKGSSPGCPAASTAAQRPLSKGRAPRHPRG